MADIFLGALILVPAILTFFLRSNGAIVFLAVCGGYVASMLAANDASDLLASSSFKLRNTDLSLLFMFLPMAFAIFLTSRAISGQSKVIAHAVAAGLAGALFILAGTVFLNISLHLNLGSTTLWRFLSSGQSAIAAGGTLYALILIMFFSKASHSKKHK